MNFVSVLLGSVQFLLNLTRNCCGNKVQNLLARELLTVVRNARHFGAVPPVMSCTSCRQGYVRRHQSLPTIEIEPVLEKIAAVGRRQRPPVWLVGTQADRVSAVGQMQLTCSSVVDSL